MEIANNMPGVGRALERCGSRKCPIQCATMHFPSDEAARRVRQGVEQPTVGVEISTVSGSRWT
jgi:hypothetical protein